MLSDSFLYQVLKALNNGRTKVAFVPGNEVMPMDPSMMGGAGGPMPPMDPGMMGGGMPPMDPSMMGGAPPIDPSMLGGLGPMPAGDAGGMPPAGPAGGSATGLTPEEIRKIVREELSAGGGGSKGAKKKVDIETELFQIKQLLVMIVQELGLPVPATLLMGPQQEGDSAGQASEGAMESPAQAEKFSSFRETELERAARRLRTLISRLDRKSQ